MHTFDYRAILFHHRITFSHSLVTSSIPKVYITNCVVWV